jgi:hypothetical protein
VGWDQASLDADARVLDRIVRAPPPEEPPRVMCISYTTGAYHEHHPAASLARTWMPFCAGALILSDTDDEEVPSTRVPHLGPEEDQCLWQKSRANWRYVLEHYGNEFDWFIYGSDDYVVLIENLWALLGSAAVQAPERRGEPVFLGKRFFFDGSKYAPPGLVFNSGGPGYVLNRAALQALVRLMDTPACLPRRRSHEEDVLTAACLATAQVYGGHFWFAARRGLLTA